MTYIEKHKDEPWTEEDFDIAMHDDRYRGNYDDWHQDMWWVLIDKTSGEALLRGTHGGEWERHGSLPAIAQLVRETD